jgi:hypothetical protein
MRVILDELQRSSTGIMSFVDDEEGEARELSTLLNRLRGTDLYQFMWPVSPVSRL